MANVARPIHRGPGPEIGLRELGKLDRRLRLKSAAKEVFASKGYDEATTREIALRAGISIGTLFVYAQDKRDLLFLVFNDELDPIAEKAQKQLPVGIPSIDRLCAFMLPWYRYFAKNVTLGRYAFREMLFYEPPSCDYGEQCDRYRARMRRIEGCFCRIVEEGIKAGDIDSTVEPSTAGNVAYSIYLSEIRRWIHGPNPDPVEGIKEIKAKLSVLFAGLQSRQGTRRSERLKTNAGRRSSSRGS